MASLMFPSKLHAASRDAALIGRLNAAADLNSAAAAADASFAAEKISVSLKWPIVAAIDELL